MPWVFAGNKAVRKYRELYHDRGWDVLIVQCHPGMVIWVPLGDAHSHKAMDMMISHPEIKDRKQIFVHAISGGIYLYFGMWRAMRRNMEKFGHMAPKMAGHIFDSGIYAGGDATANTVARIALDKRPILRNVTFHLLKQWYTSMSVHTCDLLQECLDSFADEPSYAPCLFVNALDDDKIDLNAVDRVAEGLERKGVPVINHKWEKGMHTGHLKEHPKEYRTILSEFVKQCNME
ncbi:DgyrCDS10929 [Dimorphilus gyrociliatus]|uniref:DgyrCDS10929 n=1 Tax=Dimorphilus gyrociliatus TaxID=2664684 RepID=A0A7I8W1W1_9ANNE|nr:DgyrCDS10929 [Dimorphilus gyrociliatus]